jgi:hypothetical protein
MIKDNSRQVTCSVCKCQAQGIPETLHRRCSGEAPGYQHPDNVPPRAKHQALPSASRGTWA